MGSQDHHELVGWQGNGDAVSSLARWALLLPAHDLICATGRDHGTDPRYALAPAKVGDAILALAVYVLGDHVPEAIGFALDLWCPAATDPQAEESGLAKVFLKALVNGVAMGIPVAVQLHDLGKPVRQSLTPGLPCQWNRLNLVSLPEVLKRNRLPERLSIKLAIARFASLELPGRFP